MTSMTSQTSTPRSEYGLGYSEADQDRLIRQAVFLEPMTEAFFRDAGIGAGQRVLDIGAGVGDVSMMLARLVGPSGEVVGVERNSDYVARAKRRVAALGRQNVSFVETDVDDLAIDGLFDAVVGRMVLNFHQDPVAVLRSLARLVVPGGRVAFQEVCWTPTLSVADRLPLHSRLVRTLHRALGVSVVNRDVGLDLFRFFQEAGLSAPKLRLEVPLGSDRTIAELQTDLLRAVSGRLGDEGRAVAELGDLDTLPDRVVAEVATHKAPTPYVSLVGAWSMISAR